MREDNSRDLSNYLAERRRVVEAAYREPPFPLFEINADLEPRYVADSDFRGQHPSDAPTNLNAFTEVIGLGVGRGNFRNEDDPYALCYSSTKGATYLEISETLAAELHDRAHGLQPAPGRTFPRAVLPIRIDGQSHQFKAMMFDRYMVLRTTDFEDFDLTITSRDVGFPTVELRMINDIEPYIQGGRELGSLG